jgi:hypothetical protein
MGFVRPVLLAALVLLALPAAAFAVEKTTKWFTIDVMPPDNSSPPLFLTNTSQGVKLERYRSGDPTQHWTYVHLYYPTAPPVTGTWPGEDFIKCGFGGCPFRGGGEGLRKYVNRSSGKCMAFHPAKPAGQLWAIPCSQVDAEIAKQVWWWTFGDTSVALYGPPREYTQLQGIFQGQSQCVQAASQTPPLPAGVALVPGACGQVGGEPWYQRYRFLEAASVTCKRDFDWQLCLAQ